MKAKSKEIEPKEIELEMPELEVNLAVEDILKAHKHKRNPELMKKVKEELIKRKADIEAASDLGESDHIADLKKKRNKMMTDDES